MNDRFDQPDLDLSPQLNYARPETRRHWIEPLLDVVDLLGGWIGVTFLIGLYGILLAPFAPGWLGAVSILLGMIILQLSVVYWLKKV